MILFDLEDTLMAAESNLISSADATEPSIALDAMLEPFIFFSNSIQQYSQCTTCSCSDFRIKLCHTNKQTNKLKDY
jgi:hypothetical protein